MLPNTTVANKVGIRILVSYHSIRRESPNRLTSLTGQWPGYDKWVDFINVIEAGSLGRTHITKGKLAHEVAKKIRDLHRVCSIRRTAGVLSTHTCIKDFSSVRSSERNPSWWISRIPLNQLVLLELRNVSRGSWQPVILRRV